VYGVSMQVIVLTEPNNKNCLTHNMMLWYSILIIAFQYILDMWEWLSIENEIYFCSL
jgi:hypothetical protein